MSTFKIQDAHKIPLELQPFAAVVFVCTKCYYVQRFPAQCIIYFLPLLKSYRNITDTATRMRHVFLYVGTEIINIARMSYINLEQCEYYCGL